MPGSAGHTTEAIPLLETKLFAPRWRSGLVSRPRLVERMHQGIGRKLTLVSASAGSGKTTLMAEWLSAEAIPTGWVSLDRSDNDPTRFWAYVIAALQRVQPSVGEHALALLRSPQPPPIESVLTTLINESHAIESDFALLLDDYHLIDAQPIHAGMAFLLDHLPAQMHLILATRSDPPLPLPRLRVRNELTELRAADLRFTPAEAAAFLNEVMGLALAARDVEALERRTEGWIAGLQLAALSMQGRQDIPGFITAFSGDDRYIIDYLIEEVLQRQPERVRSFLLQTSILEKLNGNLCDAVTGLGDGAEMLETLERSNLFIVPLDGKRQWYRYHHLFGDVLQAHLIKEGADRAPALHQRACEWYEANDLRADAIRHAFAAEDFERAAELVERAAPALFAGAQNTTLYGLLKLLPDELIRNRPVLSNWCAWGAIDGGEPELAETHLRDVERWLDGASDASAPQTAAPIFVDDTQFRTLPGTTATARALHALSTGDVPAAIAFAQRALELLPEDDRLFRGGATAIFGLASWTMGDLDEAYRSFADGLDLIHVKGRIHFHVAGTHVLADIRVAQGRLREATNDYEKSLQIAKAWTGPVIRGTADLYLGLSELALERGDLETAVELLQRGKDLGEHAALTENHYRWHMAEAGLSAARGDLDDTLRLIDEGERRYARDAVPQVRPFPALKARIRVRQGRLEEAMEWVRAQGLTLDDELSYMREYEHITMALVLVARLSASVHDGSPEQISAFLDRLFEAAEAGQRIGSMIEIMLLRALLLNMMGDIPSALESLEQALTLAEPEGFFRIFLNEGTAMSDLLRHAAAGGIGGAYTRKLLTACEATAEPTTTLPLASPLIEPLTRREVEILRLIAAGLRNQEIADQLFISLSTVKRHIANAYGKLDVSHRTEAVAKANELRLL